MKNILYFLIGLLIFSSTSRVQAQCPSPTFTVSDTVCPLQNLNINNNSSTTTSWNWDFCLGDLDSVPTGTVIPSVGGTLAYPQNMKLIEENGQYYGFFPNVGASYITRYDFGNSPANSPTVVNLNSDPLFGNATTGIDIVKEGNKWYGFVVCYSSNAMIRLEFDSITQLNPIVTNLNVTGLSNPNSIKLINGFAFVPNNQTAEIIRFDFGGSYANNPTVLSPSINTGAFNNFGFDIKYDCTTGKYIGYSTSSGFGLLLKLDFQNSLANIPTVSTVGSSLSGAQGIQLVEEGGNWHLFMVTSAPSMIHFTFGNSIDLPPVQQYTTTFGGIMADPKNIQLTRVGSNWIGIIPNNLLWAVVRTVFPQGCSGPVLSSTIQSPSTINFGISSLGYQRFELTETTAGTEQHFIDSTFVYLSPPLAAFSNSSACLNTPVQFTDNSTICYGSITGWQWDFGDAGTSSASNPVHIYTTSGTYLVKLTVYSATGDSSLYQHSIVVNDLPVAWFSKADSACAGADVSFLDSTTANAGVLQNWQWDFGDSNTGNGNTQVHAYQLPGTYQIQLIATTDVGCSDTVIRSINILPGPFSSFTVANTCIGETTVFNNTTTAIGTSISSYSWDFGDSNTSTLQNPSHNYSITPSQYSVQLISEAINGCIDTISRIIRIGNKPLTYFNFSTDTACSFTSIQFTDSSFAGFGDIITARYWDFGDGTIDSTSLNPTHSYNTSGSYTIQLTVKSPEDCDSTYSRVIYIIGSPTAQFNVTNACFGTPHQFTDQSTSPSGSSITNWNWYFGNGDSSTSISNSYTYADTGSYTVTLIIQSDIGCYDTTTAMAQVYNIPDANFTSGKACTDALIQFNDSSVVAGSTITNWFWDFGTAGGTSILQNPLYSYSDPFAFPVSLIATSLQGCSDTITKIIIVNQSPEFSIIASDHCEGINNSFQFVPAPGSSTSLSYLWDFGDSTASFLPNPSHNYPAAGNYNLSLNVTDLLNGCSSQIQDTVHVFPLPTANYNSSNSCVGQNVQFLDSSSIASGSITGWSWQFGSYGNANIQNPSKTFTTAGSVPVLLVITSDMGCTDSISKSIQVFNLPNVIFTVNYNYGAPPLNVQFNNTSTVGNYNWDFGDNSPISTATSPSHVYSDTGIYQATLVVTNNNGCIDSSSTQIYVLIPRPDLSINGVSYNKVNNSWEMKAIVANTGNEDAHQFELKSILEGESILYETFDKDTLKAGQTREYTFNTRIAQKEKSPSYLCIEVISINNKEDVNTENNRFCTTNSSTFNIYSIYPNPFHDELFMGVNMPKSGEIIVELTDISGRKCQETTTYSLAEGYSTILLNIESLNSAVYFLNVKYGDSEETIKLFRY